MLNKRNRDVVNINIEDLEQHFRNLNCTVMDDDPIEENEPGIDNGEFDDTILNEPITEDEILKASTKLKNNKSPGSDSIINEYFKATNGGVCSGPYPQGLHLNFWKSCHEN